MTEIISIPGEPTESAAAYRAAGIVFVIAYGAFFVLALWRLHRYMRSTRLGTATNHTSSYYEFIHRGDLIPDKKLVVHVLLVLFAVCEVIYGAFFIRFESMDYRGYEFHIFSMIFSTSAFCLIPLIWNQVLEFGGAYYNVRAFCRFAIVANFAVGSVFAGILIYHQNNFSSVGLDAAISQAAISAAIHLILSLWMLTYGLRMYCYLVSSQTKINIDVQKTRKRAIWRVLIVTVGFALCYFVRSVCAILVVLNKFGTITDNFSRIAWFLISQWIPFTIPGCLMLYVCSSKSDNKARAAASRYRDEDAAMAKFLIGGSHGTSTYSDRTGGPSSLGGSFIAASIAQATESIAALSDYHYTTVEDSVMGDDSYLYDEGEEPRLDHL